eukprot:SAG31_NODE_6422_length_2026_cov_1.555786_2_plen_46_part_00
MVYLADMIVAATGDASPLPLQDNLAVPTWPHLSLHTQAGQQRSEK